MNPRQFLLFGGAILFIVGILGYFGVIGPLPEKSYFGETWWFDNSENLVHTLLGMSALFAAFGFPPRWQKYFVLLFGVAGVLVGGYSLVSTTPLLDAHLQNPGDTILHLAIGAWALYASLVGDTSNSV